MSQLYDTKQAQKDARKLTSSKLENKALELLNIIEQDPYQNPPPYEKPAGAFSQGINIQHRLVYQVLEKEKSVKVLRLWSHYE